jgi:xylulokinase
MPEEPSRLLVLPYFTPSGTPYFDVSMKGAILGMDLAVTRMEIMRALLEGIAFEMRLNLELLNQSGYTVKELRIIGGGARSPKHVQLKADVIGMPITRVDVTEAGCLGAAMLVKALYSKREVREMAREWVKPLSTVEPMKGDHYDRKFQIYMDLYPALKGLKGSSGDC